MKTSELAPNVYVTTSIAQEFLGDPMKWLTRYKQFPVRYVGGIHSLSQHDKTEWANKEDLPLRIVELGTGREEVWFSTVSKGPAYISLDPGGRLTSHLNIGRFQPTLKQEIHHMIPGEEFAVGSAELAVWYQDDIIHRTPDRREGPDRAPAILSTKMTAPIRDDGAAYIDSVYFTVFQEYWNDGEWEKTTAGSMTIVFSNVRLNTPGAQRKILEWIAKHCQGGFFPFDDTLFGDEEEEFLFVADICTRA